MPRPHSSGTGLDLLPLAVAAASVVLVVLVGSGYAVGRSIQEGSAAGEQEPAPVAAWSGTGGVLPADDASTARLRAEGWTLPTLAADGYGVASMARGTLAGRPVVTIALQRGEDDVVVVEQRGRVDRHNPMDGLTGLPVSAEGFEASAVAGVPLWVQPGRPWRAVLVGEDVVYTVTADTSPSDMAHTVTLLMADERGRVVEPEQGESGPASTVVTGLREIFG